MNRAEVNELLRERWNITNQRFGEDTVDAWHKILEPVNVLMAFGALERCARTHTHIGLPDLFAAMPRREANPHHEPTYAGPIIPPDVGLRIAYDACVEQLIVDGHDRTEAEEIAGRRIRRFAKSITDGVDAPLDLGEEF